jgi:hypothetical protein
MRAAQKGGAKEISLEIACNPLRTLIPDERIQGNPRQSKPQKPAICGASLQTRGGLPDSKRLAPEVNGAGHAEAPTAPS